MAPSIWMPTTMQTSATSNDIQICPRLNWKVPARKARFSLRGEMMRSLFNFYLDNLADYAVKKALFQLFIAYSTAHNHPLCHFDHKSAYTAQLHSIQDVYVYQMLYLISTVKYSYRRIGCLTLRLYGFRPAVHTYYIGLDLTTHQFTASHTDSCLYALHTFHGPIYLVITSDEFLVSAPHEDDIQSVYNVLSTKYIIRDFWLPSSFLGW